MRRSIPSSRPQTHDQKYVVALLRAKVTVQVTIHDTMFALWQKGVYNRQLREGVRARCGTSYYRIYTGTLEYAAIQKFEIRIAYKTIRNSYQATYTSTKCMLSLDMVFFIISAEGVIPQVVIWPRGQSDYPRSMVLIATCVPQPTDSIVGDVPEQRRHEAKVVQMSSPHPRAGRKTTTIQRKYGKMETMGQNEVTKASLKNYKQWDHTDNKNSLGKLQRRLQHTRRYEGWKWLQRYKKVPYEVSPLEIKLYQGVFCVNQVEKNDHHQWEKVVKTLKHEPDEVLQETTTKQQDNEHHSEGGELRSHDSASRRANE